MSDHRPKLSYQELTAQLEVVAAELERSDIAIDDATHCYEQALELIKQLERHLEQAENRVHAVRTRFDAGSGK